MIDETLSAPLDTEGFVGEPDLAIPLDKADRIDFPVVALGASAGGLASFDAFFSGVTGETVSEMAFVVIQHIAPDRRSMLVELLTHHTGLETVEIRDGMPVLPGRIHVITPNRDLALEGRRFRLTPFSTPRPQRHPIDFFFRSLAWSAGENAVAVVLSGTGSDGAMGLEAVKQQGGLILSQEPDFAEFDGMPRSAVATGLVDHIIPPSHMFAQIQAYYKKARNSIRSEFDGPSPAEELLLMEILTHLLDRVGHDFSQYRISSIHRRVMRRLVVRQLTSLQEYLDLLRDSPTEASSLFRELLIGVTRFFRDPDVFHNVEEKVIPRLLEGRTVDRPLRIWVPGCSTGEEAYSLAILIAERMESLQIDTKVQIYATDIDTRAVAAARLGVYSYNVETDMSPDRFRRNFVPDESGSRVRVQKRIREMVIFSDQNLVKDPPFSRMDMISCRNLFIYLGNDLQRRLISQFHHSLNPSGFLLLGTSEHIGDHAGFFVPVDRGARIYRRLEVPRSARDSLSRNLTSSVRASYPPIPAAWTAPPHISTVREFAERTILAHAVPTALLLDSDGNILYQHGKAGRYFELQADAPGTTNAVRLAREGLRIPLTGALHKAGTTNALVRVVCLRIQGDSAEIRANLSVHPVPSEVQAAATPGIVSTAKALFLVVLEELPEFSGSVAEELADSSAVDAENIRVSELLRELEMREEHLRATQEAMETYNEELTTSNEELQSINEELQSANEELETSKEELQSVYEELTTVNTELHVKIVDLARANNDILNLLAGTGIATIFVDRSLRMMRFTPEATKVIHLIPSDSGRPIGHILTNLAGYDTLVEDLTRVLRDSSALVRDVRTHDGIWYSLRIQPYRTQEGEFEGAVLTFSDITEIRSREEALRRSQEQLELVLDNTAEAIAYYDTSRHLVWANRAYLAGLAGHPNAPRSLGEIRGRACYDVWGGPGHCEQCPVEHSQCTGQPLQAEIALNKQSCWSAKGDWQVRVAPVRDAQGAVIGTISVAHSVSEQRQLQEQIAQSEKLSALGQLAGGVAHNFNNQLSGIRGHAELLLLRTVDPELRRLAETIKDATQRAAQLTGQLLAFARKGNLEQLPLDINRITRETADLLRQTVDRRIEIKLELLPVAVMGLGDPSQLHNALLNLGLNARDAMPQGGTLRFSTGFVELDEDEARVHSIEPGSYVRLVVSDTGIGMTPEVRKRAFEPFFTTKPVGQGTGLGLASVHGTVVALGGAIKLSSEFGQGTTIELLLPRTLEQVTTDSATPVEAPTSTVVDCHVMVVDDEQIVLHSCAEMLRAMGYRVTACPDGETAIATFRKLSDDIDLVILDMVMPRLGGREVLAELRKVDSEVRVVISSGYSIDETRPTLAEGVAGFLQKPFYLAELIGLVSKLVGKTST